MTEQPSRRRERQGGFTLIELLVVVLIIGILASIAIPAFLGQRTRAQDTAAKSLLRSGAIAAESYYTDNQTFVGMVPDFLTGEEQNVVWKNPLVVDPLNLGPAEAIEGEIDVIVVSNGYALYTRSKTGRVFTYMRDANGAAYRCSGTTGPTTTPPTVLSAGCASTWSGGW
jgi:type IV pilus assembly protein PilA